MKRSTAARPRGSRAPILRMKRSSRRWPAPTGRQRVDCLPGHAHEFLQRGEMVTVMGWLERLPREVARNRQSIALELAWAFTFGNRLEEAEQLLALAEEGLETARLGEAKSRELDPPEKASARARSHPASRLPGAGRRSSHKILSPC